MANRGRGMVILSLMSSSNMSGSDKCLGQVAVNLNDCKEIYNEHTYTFNLPLGPLKYPIYNSEGKPDTTVMKKLTYKGKTAYKLAAHVDVKGMLKFHIEMPYLASNLCGTFHHISKDMQIGKKFYAMLYDHYLWIYKNAYCGEQGLKDKIDCYDIIHAKTEEVYSKLDFMQHSILEIDLHTSAGGKAFRWVWEKDTQNVREMWMNALREIVNENLDHFEGIEDEVYADDWNDDHLEDH